MKKLLTMMMVAVLLVLHGCNGQQSVGSRNPVLRCDKPVEDSVSQTFSLTLNSDSTEDAIVVFYLIDCNDTLMTEIGQSVTFNGITPLDDGYDVIMSVKWSDTVIVRSCHVTGFIHLPEPVERMTAEDLQKLINAQDKSIRRGSNAHLSQSLTLIINEALRKPQKISEVIDCISFGEWKSVIVTDIGYNEDNQITSVTLKPVGEKPISESDSEEDDDFVVYDN